MSDQVATPDPYTESGEYAVVMRRDRRAKESILRSINSADEMEQQGHRVIARGGRSMLAALTAVVGTLGGALVVGTVAWQSYDGTYDGALRANWMMLASVVGFMVAQFAWIWFVKSRELKATGQRLLVRADYLRKTTAERLQNTEGAPNEALR